MRFKSPAWIMALPHEAQMKLHSANMKIQARADAVCAKWGTRAPAPVEGTDPKKYDRDMAYMLKQKYPDSDDRIYPNDPTKSVTFNTLRGLDVYALDDSTFSALKDIYYDGAEAAFPRNDTVPPGEMREVIRVDPRDGLKQHLFYGQDSFIKDMNRSGRRVKSLAMPKDMHGREQGYVVYDQNASNVIPSSFARVA
jgi:hypothetical protein